MSTGLWETAGARQSGLNWHLRSVKRLSRSLQLCSNLLGERPNYGSVWLFAIDWSKGARLFYSA